MSLTKEQIIENIVAMEQQGAQRDEIQGYVDSLGQKGGQTPGQAFIEPFKSAAADIGLSQQPGGATPLGTAALQGGLAPFRAVGGALAATETGKKIGEKLISGLTKTGEFLTGGKAGEGLREKIGGVSLEVIEGFNSMSPQEQLKQRNKLALIEAVDILFGTKAVGQVKKATTGVVSSATERAKAVIPRATPITTVDDAVNTMVNSTRKAFVDDSTTINKALEKEAAKRSFGGNRVSADEVVASIYKNGIFPKVSGKIADFTESIAQASDKQVRLATSVDTLLETKPDLTPLASLLSETKRIITHSPQIDVGLEQSLRQVDAFFSGILKKPQYASGMLNALQINQIRKNMVRKSRAFLGEDFSQDVADAIADAIRKRLDEIEPRARKVHAEYGRIQEAKRAARIFQFKKIKVNEFAESLGSLAAVTTVGQLGAITGFAFGGLGGAAGGLVIAGIIAKWGGNRVAQMLRDRAFSIRAKKIIIDSLKKNPDFAEELINDATGANKEMLARVLLPPPAIQQPPKGGGAGFPVRQEGARVVPAPRGEPGRAKTGEFKRTYLSSEKK